MWSLARFSIGFHWLTHYPNFDEKRINTECLSKCLPLGCRGEVAEPSLEDQFIYTCAHLALHHRNDETLLQFYEIAAILQRAGESMDWQVVADRAAAWGYSMQIRYVMGQIHALWPSVIPGIAFEVINAVRISWKEYWIDRLVSMTKGNRFRSAMVGVLALPGLKNKLTAAWKQVFPASIFMGRRYGVSEESLLKAYWLRVSGAFCGFFRSRAH